MGRKRGGRGGKDGKGRERQNEEGKAERGGERGKEEGMRWGRGRGRGSAGELKYNFGKKCVFPGNCIQPAGAYECILYQLFTIFSSCNKLFLQQFLFSPYISPINYDRLYRESGKSELINRIRILPKNKAVSFFISLRFL